MGNEGNIHERVKLMKQSFRQVMDGSVSRSMRDKGVDYSLNWGATLPRLRQIADEEGKDYALAVELWKEDIRECKILATMIMPYDRMTAELAQLWMEQTPTQEIAEQAAFNLYQHIECAPQLAFEWIASDKELYQLCGYHILSRLFMNGQEPNERGINEFVDQALTAIQGNSVAVKKAAMNSVQRFAGLGLVYKRLAKSALNRFNLDFL